jgi:hypothetical protein
MSRIIGVIFAIAMLVMVAVFGAIEADAAPQTTVVETWTLNSLAGCTIAGSRSLCFQLGRYENGALVELIDAMAPLAPDAPANGAVTNVVWPGWWWYGTYEQGGVTFEWGER